MNFCYRYSVLDDGYCSRGLSTFDHCRRPPTEHKSAKCKVGYPVAEEEGLDFSSSL